MAQLALMSLYDALKEGGTSEEKARSAASDVADFEDRLHSIDSKLSILQWAVGVNSGLTLLVLGLVLRLSVQ
jgi:hypothetical protein